MRNSIISGGAGIPQTTDSNENPAGSLVLQDGISVAKGEAYNLHFDAVATTHAGGDDASNRVAIDSSLDIREVTVVVPNTGSLTHIDIVWDAPTGDIGKIWLEEVASGGSANVQWDRIFVNSTRTFQFYGALTSVDIVAAGAATAVLLEAHGNA